MRDPKTLDSPPAGTQRSPRALLPDRASRRSGTAGNGSATAGNGSPTPYGALTHDAAIVALSEAMTLQNMEATVLASIDRVIGLCSIELGDYADAELNVTRSISLKRQLAQDVEVVRGRAVLGRLMIRRGDTDPGITYLRPVRREFLKHGLIEEAGLCGLEIVEGMLTLGNHSAAETLSRRILGEFMKAGLNERAITALGYLQEAIASARASTGLVVQVREYIVSLRTVPERDFGLATRPGL